MSDRYWAYDNLMGPREDLPEVRQNLRSVHWINNPPSENVVSTDVVILQGYQHSIDHSAAIRLFGLGRAAAKKQGRKFLPEYARPDIGGPWFSYTRRDDPRAHPVDVTSTTGNAGMYGEVTLLWPAESSYRNPSAPKVATPTEMLALGTTLASRCIPTDMREADLSTFLGEMKEGLPALIGASIHKSKTARARASAAGGEYLNYEFGWAPMIRDLRNFHKAAKTVDARLEKLQKGSGKLTRTSSGIPEIKTTHLTRRSGVVNANNGLINASFQVDITDEWTQSTWFNGSWYYYLPIDSGFVKRQREWLSRADAVFGVTPDPEMIWNLAPWSWAADWFGNIGDLVALSSYLGKDGLVMRHGYVMQETKRKVSMNGVHPKLGPMSRERTEVTKQRFRASPFGFGVTYDGLSAKQVAIIASLGLSRL